MQYARQTKVTTRPRRRPGRPETVPELPAGSKQSCPGDGTPPVLPSELANDRVELALPWLRIRLDRQTSPAVPHEVTVVVPRAEIRQRQTGPDRSETEVIYSSLTVVHSPRHPLNAPPAAPGR